MAMAPVCFVPMPTYSRLHRPRLSHPIRFFALYTLRSATRTLLHHLLGFLEVGHQRSRLVPLTRWTGQLPCFPSRTGGLAASALRLRPTWPPAIPLRVSAGTVCSESVGRDILSTMGFPGVAARVIQVHRHLSGGDGATRDGCNVLAVCPVHNLEAESEIHVEVRYALI